MFGIPTIGVPIFKTYPIIETVVGKQITGNLPYNMVLNFIFYLLQNDFI